MKTMPKLELQRILIVTNEVSGMNMQNMMCAIGTAIDMWCMAHKEELKQRRMTPRDVRRAIFETMEELNEELPV